MKTLSYNGFNNFLSGGLKNKTSASNRSQKNSSSSKGKISIHRTMSAQSYLMRLASAKTPSQVNNIIRIARADANVIKNLSDSDSAIQNAKKIADAIEKKGNVKISRLRSEEKLNRLKNAQKSEGKFKKAQLTAEKLQKKRRARKHEERCDIANAAQYKKDDDSAVSAVYELYEYEVSADVGSNIDVSIDSDVNEYGESIDVSL
jgi:hypothetical protein